MDLIDRILKRAEKKRASPAWLSGGIDYYKISSRAAGLLIREAYGAQRKPPRPGYVVDLPLTTRDGRPGYWSLSNYGGSYELMFHYKETY